MGWSQHYGGLAVNLLLRTFTPTYIGMREVNPIIIIIAWTPHYSTTTIFEESALCSHNECLVALLSIAGWHGNQLIALLATPRWHGNQLIANLANLKQEGYFGTTALAIPQRILEWTSLGWKRFADPWNSGNPGAGPPLGPDSQTPGIITL